MLPGDGQDEEREEAAAAVGNVVQAEVIVQVEVGKATGHGIFRARVQPHADESAN